jgi:AmiR/NasT family two-component response regulator
VLVVEDETLIALEAEMLLAEAGFVPVGHALDSAEAKEMAIRLRPDVAIVDVQLLDGPTGVDLARFLAHEVGMVVVFATGNARHLPGDLAGAAGAIEKPYTDRRFLDVMNYLRAVLSGRPGAPPAALITPSSP